MLEKIIKDLGGKVPEPEEQLKILSHLEIPGEDKAESLSSNMSDESDEEGDIKSETIRKTSDDFLDEDM